MNKDFWERIDRLEELAEKATQGEWNVSNDHFLIGDVNKLLIANSLCETRGQVQSKANALFIAAANPAMIQEMIAEMRRLEKEADWLAEKARKCSFAYRNRSCHHLCVGNCSICLYDNRIVTAQDFREAARKAVSEADNE